MIVSQAARSIKKAVCEGQAIECPAMYTIHFEFHRYYELYFEYAGDCRYDK